MMRMMMLGMCTAALVGCASGGARVVGTATPAQTAALLDRVKTLQGAWVMKDEKGQEQPASAFAVSSDGSIVREIMFAGSGHEMTNVYHMDGPTMLMTHYCALGNQPTMRAAAGGPKVIDLKFDSVTNLHAPGDMYMGGMKLTFVDANHIKTDWTSYEAGKTVPHTTFEMWRKK